MPIEKKLQRNQNDKVIAGVSSGLAEHLNVDPVLIRLAFIFGVLAEFSGILIYVILWIAMPAGSRIYSSDSEYKGNSLPKNQGSGYAIIGVILILVGLFFILDELGIIPYWFAIHRLWPLAIIVAGIMILTRSNSKNAANEEKKQENNESENVIDKDQSI